jgi:phosphatidylinositol alpha-mannosyltransferase
MTDDRLRITQLFDSNYDSPGGVPQYMDTLSGYFERQGHASNLIVGETVVDDPHVVSLGRTFPFPLNGNVVDVPYPTRKRQVARTLQEVDPDILHIGMTYFPTTGGRFITQAKPETGVVGTFHVLPYRRSSDIGLRLANVLLGPSKRRIDHVLTASPVVQDFAKSAFGLESTIVPCPVDIQRFKDGKRLSQYDDGKVNVMFLGRLEERKGAGHLIDSVGQLSSETLKDTRVVIGGRGKLESALRRKVSALGLEQVVEFAGRVDESDKADFLASADMMALPATSGESFGIVVAEAIAACGVVIGGDNPGYRSILQKRTPETIVDPTNHRQFAEVLRKLISSERMRTDMSARQQENIAEYDVATVGATILSIYNEVLTQRRG